jgi:hypothetical protein
MYLQMPIFHYPLGELMYQVAISKIIHSLKVIYDCEGASAPPINTGPKGPVLLLLADESAEG